MKLVTSFVAIVFVSSFFAVSFSCQGEPAPTSQQVQEPQIPAHFTTYTNEDGLFQISYPPDWEPVLSIMEELEQDTKEVIKSIDSDTPVEQVSLIFVCGLPTAETWLPNLSILVESIPGFTGKHDEAVEAEIGGMKQLYPDYHEFSRIDVKIDGKKATIIDSEATIPGMGKNHPIQMITVAGKTIWVVTCTPEPGKFEQSEEDFYAIVRSLRILK